MTRGIIIRFEFKIAHFSKITLRVKLMADPACSDDKNDTEQTLIAKDLDNMEKTEQDPFDYEDLMLPEEENEPKDKEQANGAKL